MTRKVLITSAVIAAVGIGALAASPTFARGGASGGPCGGGSNAGAMMFERFDTDGDGAISREEFATGHAQRFTTFDDDGNGEITLDEFKTGRESRRQQRMETRFQALDGDGDGVVTKEEIAAKRPFGFEDLDADGNGVISQDEARDHMLKMRDSRERGGGWR